MNIEELYSLAKNENIEVKKYDLGKELIWKGQCILDNNYNCFIFINKHIQDADQEKCVLAHELGHFKKGITNNNIFSTNYRDTLIRSINDFRANKWAVGKLIPFSVFKSFLNTNMSKYDVAKELEVEEGLIELACHVYEPLILELEV